MKNIIINKNDAGQRIDKFLFKFISNIPQALAYKYIRKKRIKINNKKCKISDILKEKDIINLYINDEFFDKNENIYDFLKASSILNIIYEDDNIILIDKKPGLIVHQDKNFQIDCLINRVKNYLYIKQEYNPENENSFSPSLANRIDLNTGGIVIVAKNSDALRILNQKIKNKEIQKKYLCVTYGDMPKDQDILTGFLEKNQDKNKVYINNIKTEKSKIIKTKYKIIKKINDLNLLEIELITGRTHQIRAHLASIGFPIVGDGKYGNNYLNKKFNYKYQLLYSYKLKFNFNNSNLEIKNLDYLNKKEFIVKNVWFLEELQFKIQDIY